MTTSNKLTKKELNQVFWRSFVWNGLGTMKDK